MATRKPSATAKKMVLFLEEHKDKTQSDQAKILGVHVSTISYWRRKVKQLSQSSTPSFVELSLPKIKPSQPALMVKAGNYFVEVPSNFDGAHLRNLLKEICPSRLFKTP